MEMKFEHMVITGLLNVSWFLVTRHLHRAGPQRFRLQDQDATLFLSGHFLIFLWFLLGVDVPPISQPHGSIVVSSLYQIRAGLAGPILNAIVCCAIVGHAGVCRI